MRMPNGYGSVIKLSGKRRKQYGVRVTVGWDGEKQIRKYIGYYETKRDAIVALAEYSQNPYDVDSRKTTFEEVYQHWAKDNFDKGSKSSQSAWKVGFSHCEPIHQMRIVDIKLMHMESLMNGKGHSTRGQIKTVCSKVFKHAIKHEWTDKDPSQHLEIGKKETKTDKTVYSDKEIKDMWKKVKEDDFYELMLILLYTGLRITELLEIRQENVFDDYMIGGKKSDAGIDRTIPLHKKIRKFIKKRLDGTSEFLIRDEENKPITYSQFHYQFDQRITGHTIHETRHTFISRMHSAGCNEITLKIIVGHALTDITSKVYIHKEKEELVKSVHLID